LGNLLHAIPFLVVLLEYTAGSSALAFAKFAADFEPESVSLLGGLVNVGGNLPYDAVPNAVATLHMLALLLSTIYFVYFMFFAASPETKQHEPVPPQEG
jgi:hypothetical protein